MKIGDKVYWTDTLYEMTGIIEGFWGHSTYSNHIPIERRTYWKQYKNDNKRVISYLLHDSKGYRFVPKTECKLL